MTRTFTTPTPGDLVGRYAGTQTPSGNGSDGRNDHQRQSHRSPKFNLAEIKAEARGRWAEIITALTGINDIFLTSIHGECPKCCGGPAADRWRVFDDFAETGGAICNQCGPKMADGFAVIGWYLDIKFSEVIRLVAKHLALHESSVTRPAAPKVRAPKPKQRIDDQDEAAIDFAHKILQKYLQRMGLADDHRDALTARGLTVAAIASSQYATLDRRQHQMAVMRLTYEHGHRWFHEVPGFREGTGCDPRGLLIPVRDREGRIRGLQIRLDEHKPGGSKYIWMSGIVSPGSPTHFSAGCNTEATASVRLTEGALKAAISHCKTGIPAIAIAGVGLWQRGCDAIAALQPNRTLVAFDADWRTNPAVRDALRGTVRWLREHQIRFAIETWDPISKGIDDALMAVTEITEVDDPDEIDRLLDGAATGLHGKDEADQDAADKTDPTAPGGILDFEGVANYEIIESEEENEKGKTVVVEKKSPFTAAEIAEQICKQHSGFPKCAAGQLFYHGENKQIHWLKNPNQLFGFLRSESIVTWGFGEKMVSKQELFEALPRHVENYLEVEKYPHFPQLIDHYYACDVPVTGNGKTLETLIGFFAPLNEEVDRQLIKAFITSLFWGGHAGSRPGWLITAEGTGSGKTTFVSLLSSLVGGLFEFGANTEDEKLRTDLVTPDPLGRRIVLLDNIKTSRLSSATIEALITTQSISGHRLYHGFASRPNSLIWTMTMNGHTSALSRDMAERTINLQLAKAKHADGWEPMVREFISANRDAIIADIAQFFLRPTQKITKHSRWAEWEAAVLGRLVNPDQVQQEIQSRRNVSNADAEEASTIRNEFERNLILGVANHYSVPKKEVDLSMRCLSIPMGVAAAWIGNAIGERMTPHAAGKLIDRLNGSGGLPELSRNPSHKHGRSLLWTGSKSHRHVDYECIAKQFFS